LRRRILSVVRGLLTEDDETSSKGNHPVSAEPSATAAGSSNPTPRTNSEIWIVTEMSSKIEGI
jgi:hypothetical protein